MVRHGCTSRHYAHDAQSRATLRYPSALYAHKVQGRHAATSSTGGTGASRIDAVGSLGIPRAVQRRHKGSQELTFIPAKKRNEPMAVSVLYPVYFRHPDAAPLPGDTILQRYKPVPPK